MTNVHNINYGMYDNTCELVLKMMVERLRISKDVYHKKNKDLYKDAQLVSSIMNFKRDDKKNKYLLPSRSDCIESITSALNFNSSYELLWGNTDEINAYAGALFYNLINDSFEGKDKTVSDETLDILLDDYIPFALNYFFFTLFEKHRDEIYGVWGKKYYTDVSDAAYEYMTAVNRLYIQVRYGFIEKLKIFLYKKEDTSKLQNAFRDFYKETILPFLKEEVSKNRICKENIFKTLCEYEEDMLYYSKNNLKTSSKTFQLSKDDRYCEIVGEKLYETLEHFEKLAILQEEQDKLLLSDYDYHYLMPGPMLSDWTPVMCI